MSPYMRLLKTLTCLVTFCNALVYIHAEVEHIHYDAATATVPDIRDEDVRALFNCNACMVVVDELQMSIQTEASKRSSEGGAKLTATGVRQSLRDYCTTSGTPLTTYGLQYIDPFTAGTHFSDQDGGGWPRLLRLPWITEYLSNMCGDMVNEMANDMMHHMQKKYDLPSLQDTMCGVEGMGLCIDGVTDEMYVEMKGQKLEVMEPREHMRPETASVINNQNIDEEAADTSTPHIEL
mmetsp:Transcript_20373/g.24461  ORF Transcript_20373/g.24461 Transcript_20373/m.24461 type:complete len:236 (+) Transcript_20373:211-918(+)|eukprot:CAMPEP_0197860110 /NCGR_PEP_ID=MMETSP1438-20131217/35259_1 /TAXON_ID=1461541 /ORGANISM="Pterosperma sp., Strain CCMP1384" /LENGTH=235 /DNA_ID=CAMNT_0043476867 /DNA_START=146 /DNA_END=853 /DNA_ORIENTATION=+